ncbi:MAG: hypothetical protein IIY21_12145 [Clostridiales bacterium]|nr:hypothetical protein [Clostridiales bacterium]MBQ1573147.1 hypothetical protein [Clostridiales bacterium]
MRTISIKGKEYVPVTERVKEFRRQYPDFKLITEIVHYDDNSVIMVAKIYDQDGKMVANGHAQEDRNASNINKTSYVENCETSAVGRAIGMLGIGIDASMASAEEVANAVDRQETLKQKVNKNCITSLKMLADEKGSDFSSILSYYDLEKVEDMTMEQWQSAMQLLNRKK